jgi:hypothetical protein
MLVRDVRKELMMKTRRRPALTRLAPSMFAVGLAVSASCLSISGCGSDSSSPGAGGAGGGSGGRGGQAGGQGGQGGQPGQGGGGGGSGGAGGGAGGGGAGTGGAAGGGQGGGSGGSGGNAGDGGGSETAPGDAPAGDATAYLDSCFAGLRNREGDHQTSTKVSADGSVRLRLALETADRFGTSGTKPWGVIRLALIAGATRICIKDEAMLAGVYKGSRHNCTDTLELTVDGTLYRIEAPDTHPDRNEATFRALRGGTMVSGPTKLPTTSCTARSGACQSGQPC